MKLNLFMQCNAIGDTDTRVRVQLHMYRYWEGGDHSVIKVGAGGPIPSFYNQFIALCGFIVESHLVVSLWDLALSDFLHVIPLVFLILLCDGVSFRSHRLLRNCLPSPLIPFYLHLRKLFVTFKNGLISRSLLAPRSSVALGVRGSCNKNDELSKETNEVSLESRVYPASATAQPAKSCFRGSLF